MSVAKKLVTGSSLRFITLLANICVAFFMLPYMLDSLGEEIYGMWVIIGSIISFYGMLDLGLSSATQRFFAYELPRGNLEELNKVLSTSFFLFILIGITALVITLISAIVSTYFFENSHDVFLFRRAFTIIGVGVAISFPFYVFNGVLTANLRYDYSCYIQLVKLFTRTLLFVYLLENNATIVELAVATVVADMMGFMLLYLFSRKLAPDIQIKYSFFDTKRMKKYFNFGGFAVLSSASDNARQTVDSLILGAFTGLSTVAHYNIASMIAIYVFNTLNSIFGLLTPLFTNYHSREQTDIAREKLFFVTKLATIISVLAIGIIASIGGPFISMWVGSGFLDSYYPLIILTTSAVIAGMQIPNRTMLFAIDKHQLYGILNIVEVVLNVVISLALVERYGMVGVAFGSLIPIVIFRFFFQPIYLSKLMNTNLTRHYFEFIKVFLIGLILHAPFYYAVIEFYDKDNFLWVLGGGALYYPFAALLLFRFTLKKNEFQALFNVFQRKIAAT